MATETLDQYIAGNKSPPLVAVKELNLRHISPSPPLASRDSSAVPSDEEDGKPNQDLEPGSQGDYVLLSQSAPNHLHAAKHALKYALPVIEKNNLPAPRPMSLDPPSDSSDQPAADQVEPRGDPLKQDSDGDFVAQNPPPRGGRSRKESIEGSLCRRSNALSFDDKGPPSPTAEKRHQYDTRPPPLRPQSLAQWQGDAADDSLAQSPVLSKFTIDGRHADPSAILAAIHTTSPPRSVGSPEARQTLPSLTTALGDAGSPFSAPSPRLSRSASSQFGGALSSIPSAMSPPSYSSNPSFWRTTRDRANSTSTPSDYAVSASTPHSAWTAQSPAASLPTPLSSTSSNLGPPAPPPSAVDVTAAPNGALLSPTQPSPSDHSATSSISSSAAAVAAAAAAAAAAVTGIFRCSIPGCTAVPFQTQYLLNSHMNVHSDTRPHFCPVKNCPRGPGGQGFKRKNEMIRHGLVHTSPGYTCPFCPDQQHRYPRPDNLQRHVRVHHMDKDRDDPALREVLAQRPEGGSRGRRRRLGS